MKKRLLSALLCTAMVGALVTGCGNSGSGSAPDSTAGETAAEGSAESEVVTNTYGDPNGTHLEMWTFVELHAQHYGTMAEVWNEQHPDQTIEITCTTYPYADMHTKLLTALEAGTGAPDICDVEVGQFPNAVEGLDTWLVPLNDYAADYLDTMVTARMETYMGEDGKYYGEIGRAHV